MCLKPIKINEQQFKCNKCPECNAQRKELWTWRIEQEIWNDKKKAFFVTLTYDDTNIPTIDKSTGEIEKGKFVQGTLDYTDIQKYWKRIRKSGNKGLRYYVVGEYGSKTKRPHYHAIVIGVSQDEIRKHWKNGFVYIGDVKPASIKYVIKYMSKREKDTPEGSVKPRANMSLGLGKKYLKHKKWHLKNGELYVTNRRGVTIRLPRSWWKEIWTEQDINYLLSLEKMEMEANLEHKIKHEHKGDVSSYLKQRNQKYKVKKYREEKSVKCKKF